MGKKGQLNKIVHFCPFLFKLLTTEVTQLVFKPHDYQIAMANFIYQKRKCGLFADMGTGKTATVLWALSYIQPSGHILVIAPKNIARSTWVDEIAKWGFNIRTKSLLVNDNGKKLTRKKRLERYEQIRTDPPTMYFINRELIVDLIQYIAPKDKSKWCFPTVIVDEMQSFKSYKSSRFKALKEITPYTSIFIGLTGTPMPKDLQDLWSQLFLLDNGLRLGKNITTYRNTFFRPGRIVDNYPIEWLPLPGAREEIYRRISDIVISVQNENLNLPPLNFNNIKCYMDSDEMAIYKKFKKEQVIKFEQIIDDAKAAAMNDPRIVSIQDPDDKNKQINVLIDKAIARNAAVLTAKLSQMASGAIYVNNSEEYKVIHTKKLEMCEYIINNTSGNVIIAYYFHSDRDMLLEYLKKKGMNPVIFDGSPEMVHDWNDDKIPVMLLQPKSAGHGLNLQDGNGHTLIWYTLPWSLEEYLQTIKRLHRQGQKNPVMIFQLISEKTIDKRILSRLDAKDTSEKSLLDAVKLELGTKIA